MKNNDKLCIFFFLNVRFLTVKGTLRYHNNITLRLKCCDTADYGVSGGSSSEETCRKICTAIFCVIFTPTSRSARRQSNHDLSDGYWRREWNLTWLHKLLAVPFFNLCPQLFKSHFTSLTINTHSAEAQRVTVPLVALKRSFFYEVWNITLWLRAATSATVWSGAGFFFSFNQRSISDQGVIMVGTLTAAL